MGIIPAIPADVYNHQLYYTAPATIWEETLPLGNGRLGMMPDGGVDQNLAGGSWKRSRKAYSL